MDNYEPTQLQMATTDELIREVHARHPNMVVVFEKDPLPNDQSTLNIYGPDASAAAIARTLGLLEAAKQQMQFDFLMLQKKYN